MGAYKINAAVRNKIQGTGITLMDVYLSICTFVFKINLFFASVKSDIVDVNTNNISAEQLRFNQRCPTARKLIKHQISFF